MNTIVIDPVVAGFLDAVRTHLADLDADEQREILDGLEADLGELVAEQGPSALGDPAAYASELRAAAGLDVETGRARGKRPIRTAVTGFLDACHDRFDALVSRSPWDVTPLLAWARPLWWILRAWVAVVLVQSIFGSPSWSGTGVVPDLGGVGWLALVGAVATSVWIGLGRLWPGGRNGLATRLVLLVLNLFAIAMTPVAFDQIGRESAYWDGYAAGYDESYSEARATPIDDQAGIYSNGSWVSNIYPYDADGKPLVGVQLYDQNGKPINVVTQPDCETTVDDPHPEAPVTEDGVFTSYCMDQGYDAVLPRVFYPWNNGAAQVFNMFPLPSRFQEDPEPTATAFTDKDRPTIGIFPMETVPKASLPGLKTGSR